MPFPAFTPAQFSLTGRRGLHLALVVLAFAAALPLLLFGTADLVLADHPFRLLALALGGIAAALLGAGLLWLLVGNIHRRQEAERQILRATADREMDERLSYIAADFPGEIFRRVMRPDGTLFYPLLRGRSMDLMPRQADLIQGAPVGVLAKAYIHPDDAERWQGAILHSAATLEPYDIEWRPLSPDGEERWVRSMARAKR